MASHVFIAHTERDQQTAAAVCAALERNGMRGWLIFRDVPMGMDPRTALFQAIDAGAACVLILSAQTDTAALAEQINRAKIREMPLIALRLASTFPTQDLAETLRTAASVYADAIPSETQLGMLVNQTQSALSHPSPGAGSTTVPPAVPDTPVSVPPPFVPALPTPPITPGPPMSAGAYSATPPSGVPPVVAPSGVPVLPNYSGSGYIPPPGQASVYNTAPPAPFAAIAALGWCVVVLLAGNFLLDMTGVVFGLLQAQLLSRMSSLGSFSVAEVMRNDNRVQLVGILQLVTLAATATFLLTWMYRAYKNLSALGAEGLTLSPGWAAGGFFVPFLNLVRPYQAMSEIWRVSDPRFPQEHPSGWLQRSTSPLVGFWWGCWLCSGAVGSISFQFMKGLATDPQARVEGLITGTWCQIVSDSFSLASGILLAAIVWTVSRRQEQRRKQRAPQEPRAVNSAGALAPILTGFGLALLLGVTSMVVLGLQGMGTTWKEFTPPGAGFTVSMPGDPAPQTQPGDGVTVYLYTSNDETAQYLSSYFDVAESGTLIDAATEYDSLEKLKMDAMHGVLGEAHDIHLGAYSGREFVVTDPLSAGTQNARIQLFLVGVRVFQLMVLGDTEALHSANADKFFQSLSIRYQPPAAAWRKFSPPGHEYSVLMPGTPTPQTQTDSGISVKMYISNDGPTQYLVSYLDTGLNRISDPAQLIDAVEKDKAEEAHTKLSEEQRISVGPYVGKEFVLRNADEANGQVMRMRLFLVGNRLFQMLVMGNDTAVHSADADKFFSSIHTQGM